MSTPADAPMDDRPAGPGTGLGVPLPGPAVHGGIDPGELEQLGLDPGAILDFSTNVNPFGPTEAVRAAVAAADLGRYPDRECRRLRDALAAHHGVSAERIVAGNGASELIHLVAAAFLRPGDRVLVASPAFGEYERAARLAGAEVVACWTMGERPGTGAEVDARVPAALGAAAFRVAFVANPGNPTGDELAPGVIEDWAATSPATLFVVDEAYAPFTGDQSTLVGGDLANVLVLRSMTKHLALAGIRLGYAVGPEPIVEAVAARRPPWTVSAVAQAAGVAALEDGDAVLVQLERLAAEKAFLLAGLASLGYEPRPSATPYFLVPVGNAAESRSALLGHGILVRDCASFGLPGHVRISPRDRASNERMLAAIPARGGTRSTTPTPTPDAGAAIVDPEPVPGSVAVPPAAARSRRRIDPIAELVAAVGLLTRLRVGHADPERTGSAAFPLVGAALGALAAVPAALLAGSAPLLGAALVPAVLAVLTGALHLDGLADTCDALAASTPERAEAARKDPRIGAAGAAGLALLLLATVGAITAIPGWAIVAAGAVAGAASRAVPAVAAVAIRPTVDPGTGFGAWFAAHAGRGGAAVALLVVAAVAVGAFAAVALAAPAGPAASMPAWVPAAATIGSAAAGLGAGLALAARLNRRFGRLAGDHHGAAIEVAFVVALGVAAVAWGAGA